MSRVYHSYSPRSPSPLRNCIASQSKPYVPDLDVPKDRPKKSPKRTIPKFDLRKAVLINESCRPPKLEGKAKAGQKRKFGETREDDVVEIRVHDEQKPARKRTCTDVDFYLRPQRPCAFAQ